MKTVISEIATVSTGPFFRTLKDKIGKVTYLQARHFDDHGELREKLTPNLLLEDNEKRNLLKEGDILVASKGTRIFTVEYKDEFGPCVASSNFYVVKILNKEFLSRYISIYINSLIKTNKFKKENLSGVSIFTIRINAINSMEVPILSIEQQKSIIKAYKLCKKQIRLYSELINKKKILLDNFILNIK